MAKKNRAQALERRVSSGADHIEMQRRVIERLEASGDMIIAAAARVVLATMERGRQVHTARRERIKRLLAEA